MVVDIMDVKNDKYEYDFKHNFLKRTCQVDYDTYTEQAVSKNAEITVFRQKLKSWFRVRFTNLRRYFCLKTAPLTHPITLVSISK